MLDIGWSEMAVVAVIALVIIGPKDLPRIMRQAGKWAGKARSIAREFRNSLDDMVRESELADVKKDIEVAASYDIKKEVENTVDPTGVLTPNLDPTAPDAEGDVKNDSAKSSATGGDDVSSSQTDASTGASAQAEPLAKPTEDETVPSAKSRASG